MKSNVIAQKFFEADIDEHFKSTITEARLWFAVYKNFQDEIEDHHLKVSMMSGVIAD